MAIQPYSNSALQSLFGGSHVVGLGDDLTQQAEDQNEELRRKAAQAALAKKIGSAGGLAGQSPLSNSAAMQSLFGGI